jgi:hypothetical protein
MSSLIFPFIKENINKNNRMHSLKLLLKSVAAETGACVPLRSKLTSASTAIPAFMECLPSRCLANGQMHHNIIFEHPVAVQCDGSKK